MDLKTNPLGTMIQEGQKMNNFCSLILIFFANWVFSQNADSVSLTIKIKGNSIYYTISNNSTEDIKYVDFTVNESYFFVVEQSDDNNICGTNAKQVKLNFEELRRKYCKKIKRGKSKTKKLKAPRKYSYRLLSCDKNKGINLRLVYSPGMFITEDTGFIENQIFSNTIQVSGSKLKELKI